MTFAIKSAGRRLYRFRVQDFSLHIVTLISMKTDMGVDVASVTANYNHHCLHNNLVAYCQ